MEDINTRAVIGANLPPDPFDAHRVNLADWLEQAEQWLDGAQIENAEQASAVELLLDALRKGFSAADVARAEEKRPFDEAAKAVQAKWLPILNPVDLAVKACRQLLTSWRNREAARVAAEQAEATRIANEAALAAAEAARTAQPGDLRSMQDAEELLRSAKSALKDAKDIGKQAPKRMRTVYDVQLVDYREAAAWAFKERKPELSEFLLAQGKQIASGGRQSIPGFIVAPRKEAY